MKRKNQITRQPLERGQVWKMKDANLHIEVVGKRLVHYKLFRGEAKRAPTSLSGKEVVEQYLEDNDAVLLA